MLELRVIGISGLPEIVYGDDIGKLIVDETAKQDIHIKSGDILVVAQKVVSKAEGRVVNLKDIEPSKLAFNFASENGGDPRHIELVLRETKRIVRMEGGLIISETQHGFRCANAGVDASNVPGEDMVTLLPIDADASSRSILKTIQDSLDIDIGIIISDTFGRPWRDGAVNVAIGIAGLSPLKDYRKQYDRHGYNLKTTTIAIADELASAGELVMGKLDGICVALIRGYSYSSNDTGIGVLVRPSNQDLFR